MDNPLPSNVEVNKELSYLHCPSVILSCSVVDINNLIRCVGNIAKSDY